MFPPRYGVRRLPANESVCTYPGLASFVLYEDSVKAIIPVLVDVVREAGFDGMYLDNRVNPATFASEEPIMKLFRDTSKQVTSLVCTITTAVTTSSPHVLTRSPLDSQTLRSALLGA